MGYRIFTVDRLEGDTAVLVNDNDGTDRLNVDKNIFPMTLVSGMVLRIYEDGHTEEDPVSQEERQKRIDNLMGKVFKKK